LPFNLSLINLERMPRDLTALEEGAWVERMELTITFVYNDIVEIGDIKFTLTPSVVEDVKDIIKFETIVKNDND
jgi:hypothetical protein